jgi:acyl-CoA thioesterase-1
LKSLNGTVLFQGDSITCANRNRHDPRDLGIGYAKMVAEQFSAEHPEKDILFLNRGVNGNRVRDLKNRWQEDCVTLKPSVVSILIGINDALRYFVWTRPTPIERFEVDYRNIIERTKIALDAQLILLEPFALPVTKKSSELRKRLDAEIQVVRKLSAEFGTPLISLDKIFAEEAKRRGPLFWSQDGIHPTLSGHVLIAKSWLELAKDKLS